MGDIGPIGNANIGAASAIFDERGRVLLVKHTYGHFNWEIPGGIALPSEPPSVAAQRELREETTLELPEGELSGVYYDGAHRFGPMIHFCFRHEPMDPLAPLAQPPEIGELGWFLLDQLPAPMSDFTELRIRDALEDAVAYRIVASRVWRMPPG
jgi:8-oxo-dGTP diphosphatase